MSESGRGREVQLKQFFVVVFSLQLNPIHRENVSAGQENSCKKKKPPVSGGLVSTYWR